MGRLGCVGIVQPFVVDGRYPSETGVPSARVIPGFDVVEDRHLGLCLRSKTPLLQEFTLERGEEALAQRVVVAVADRSHRGAHTRPPSRDSDGDRSRSARQTTTSETDVTDAAKYLRGLLNPLLGTGDRPPSATAALGKLEQEIGRFVEHYNHARV